MSDVSSKIRPSEIDESCRKCKTCDKVFARRSSMLKHVSAGRCPMMVVPPIIQPTISPITLPTSSMNISSNFISDLGSDAPDWAQKLMNAIGSLKNTDLVPFTGDSMAGLSARVEGLEDQIKKKPAPMVNNNNLNLVCFRKDDDFLAILEGQLKALNGQSPLKQALTFIKHCALAKLAGDCRLLERMYFPEGKRPAIMFANHSKSQYIYYDENNQRVVETSAATIARQLADNLQRTYLSGSKLLKHPETGKFIIVKDNDPDLPKTEEYDLQLWNAHVHELNDEKYQKKLLKSLKIQFERDVKITM